MTIAPWLHPPNFIAAMSAGAEAGLRARSIANQSIEAGDRLREAYDQLAASERREQEATAAKLSLAHASMALKAQQQSAMQAYQQGELANRRAAIDAAGSYHQGLLQGHQAALDLRERELAKKGEAKDYGDPTFADVPGVPGAKVAYRKGSPGMHGFTQPKAPSTSGLDATRLRVLQNLPKQIAALGDMEKGTPEYAAAADALKQTQDYLKRTAPGSTAEPGAKKASTHRYDPATGTIVPISSSIERSAGAALRDHEENPQVQDTVEFDNEDM